AASGGRPGQNAAPPRGQIAFPLIVRRAGSECPHVWTSRWPTVWRAGGGLRSKRRWGSGAAVWRAREPVGGRVAEGEDLRTRNSVPSGAFRRGEPEKEE